MHKANRVIGAGLAAAMAATMSLGACSTKGNDTGSTSTGGIKTDNGVTDKTIILGIQTDQSGVFKEIGLGLTHGHRL